MYFIHSYLAQNRAHFGLPSGHALQVTLLAPWRQSNTSRPLFLARCMHESRYRIAIQESISITGIRCRNNLYEPSFHEKINYLLPKYRGSFFLNHSEYYWSEFINYPSLLFPKKNMLFGWRIKKCADDLSRLSKIILDLQEDHKHLSSLYISDTKQLITENIGKKSLSDLFFKQTESYWSWVEECPDLLCSWGHGGLWPKDIFMFDQHVKLIDWEWAMESAPIGSDIVDFYIYCCEALVNLTFEQALSSLMTGGICLLRAVRQELLRKWEQLNVQPQHQKCILVFSILRRLGILIADEGYPGQRHIPLHLEMLEFIVNKEFVFVH